jgi:hypothetical protein
MTVRAANIALLDLCGYHRPWLANHKEGHVSTFGRAITVIKLKRDDVAFTAVNARMRTQIRTQKTPILGSAAPTAINLTSDVLGPIAQVMRSAICRMTRAAVGLPCAQRLTSKCERRDGLKDVAPNAQPQRFAGLCDF